MFVRWSDRLAAATDEGARRALLAEIGIHRVRRLSDVAEQREAAFALSRLHRDLGDAGSAVREAETLVSMLGIEPLASDEEAREARRLLAATKGGPEPRERAPRGERPARADRPERAERPERGDRAERPARGERPARDAAPRDDRRDDGGGLDAVRDAAAAGRWDAALAKLGDPRSPKAELWRTWLVLARALGLADIDRRGRDLFALEAHLRERLLADRPAPAARVETPRAESGRVETPREPKAEGPATHALAALLGGPVPTGRDPLVERLDAAVAAGVDPDALAAAALEQHVEAHGLQSPAPWLVGLVARARVAGGTATGPVVERLRAAGAWAVTAYGESAFFGGCDAWRAAAAAGWSFGSLRRGVLSRGEPNDRRTWTLRVTKDGVEVLVAIAPDAELRDDLAARLADRVAELSGRVVWLAPGPALADLRAAAAARGAVVVDGAELPDLGALTFAAPAEPAPRAPRGRGGEDAIKAAVSDPGVTVDALVPLLAALPRVWRGLAAAREALEGLELPEIDRGLAIVLEAADQAAPEGVRIAEGTTLAVDVAARCGDGSIVGAALASGPVADRFGGPYVSGAVTAARALIAAGGTVDRVHHGVTARERREDPVLEALGDALDGVWRVLGKQGDRDVEAWFVGALPPDAAAAVPRLLLVERPRAVIVADDAVAKAWAVTGGPAPVDAAGAVTALAG